ncbi:MAG: GLPGLI family protein [Tannerella sp.]|jgi:GLPGLI family protein|nr:GLPGLI family protein [Tannerella sp.]
MKKMTFPATIAAFCLLAASAHAQIVINIVNPDEALKSEPIDEVLFTAQYEMTSVADTAQRDRTEKEMMMLKAGARSSVFYSYAKYLTDSVIEADKASGASVDVIVEHINKYRSRINYKIYKNYPNGKTTTLEHLAINRFRCEENNDVPRWELFPDTATLLGYTCRKAVCRFKGRDYEAWFTEDIPRSEGPWKLQGLPGLILKAQDARREYVFECVALIQGKPGDSIAFGASGHEPISRKDLNRLFERYAADPAGYIASAAPNVKVQIRNKEGEAISPKNTPYNPIELSEQ